jgi:hypothetical protein
MALKMAKNEAQKVTITLPKLVLQRLNEVVPARQRSRFISEVLAERLALEEQVLALEESAGVWTEESHPEMKDGAAIDRWLTSLRQSWTTPKGAADDSLSA